MKVRVRFLDVGRDHKSWEAEVPGGELMLPAIAKEVTRSGALLTKVVGIILNGSDGEIYAGTRCVGLFVMMTEDEATA